MASFITFMAVVEKKTNTDSARDCADLIERYRAAFTTIGLTLEASPIREISFAEENRIQWRSDLRALLARPGQRQTAVIAANSVKASAYTFMNASPPHNLLQQFNVNEEAGHSHQTPPLSDKRHAQTS